MPGARDGLDDGQLARAARGGGLGNGTESAFSSGFPILGPGEPTAGLCREAGMAGPAGSSGFWGWTWGGDRLAQGTQEASGHVPW